MNLEAKTDGDDVAYIDLGAFEICISNNLDKPAKKMYALNEDVRPDNWPTFYGQGVDALDAYRYAYYGMLSKISTTTSQKKHLEMLRTILFREHQVIDKKVNSKDKLPFTCTITARF